MRAGKVESGNIECSAGRDGSDDGVISAHPFAPTSKARDVCFRGKPDPHEFHRKKSPDRAFWRSEEYAPAPTCSTPCRPGCAENIAAAAGLSPRSAPDGRNRSVYPLSSRRRGLDVDSLPAPVTDEKKGKYTGGCTMTAAPCPANAITAACSDGTTPGHIMIQSRCTFQPWRCLNQAIKASYKLSG